MVHVCVGFYSNGDYVVNMVDDKDLADNIKYNSTFRPGRFYYVDGKYACGGMLIPDAQKERIAQHEAQIAEMNRKPTLCAVTPYK